MGCHPLFPSIFLLVTSFICGLFTTIGTPLTVLRQANLNMCFFWWGLNNPCNDANSFTKTADITSICDKMKSILDAGAAMSMASLACFWGTFVLIIVMWCLKMRVFKLVVMIVAWCATGCSCATFSIIIALLRNGNICTGVGELDQMGYQAGPTYGLFIAAFCTSVVPNILFTIFPNAYDPDNAVVDVETK